METEISFTRQDNIHNSNAKKKNLKSSVGKKKSPFPQEKTSARGENTWWSSEPREGQISDILGFKRKSKLNILFSDRYFSMN